MTTITTTTTTVTTDMQYFGNVPPQHFHHARPDSGDIGCGNGGVPSSSHNYPGGNVAKLPSEAAAAKTIRDFQSNNNIGLLSVEQVRQMADTGYYTGKDGKMVAVPPDVQMASQRLLANNSELFRKLESAVTGGHDGLLSVADYTKLSDKRTLSDVPGPRGLSPEDYFNGLAKGALTRPSEYGAAKTIGDFQKQQGIELLTAGQIDLIADTGYITDKTGNRLAVPEEVQGAAQRMMANGGELFKKLERAVTGTQDGLLSTQDFDQSVSDRTVARDGGTEAVAPYGGAHGGGHGGYGANVGDQAGNTNTAVTTDQAGTTQKTDKVAKADKAGKTEKTEKTEVPAKTEQPEQTKETAQAEQPGQTKETAKTEKPGQAKEIAKTENTEQGKQAEKTVKPDKVEAKKASPNLPSMKAAAETVSDFRNVLGKEHLTLDDVQNMAKGKDVKHDDGTVMAVREEVKLAAQKLLENGGEGFQKLDAGKKGDHDGKVGKNDFKNAAKNGTLDKTETNKAPLPSENDAAATLQSYMKDKAMPGLSKEQLEQIEQTGYCTHDGKTFRVPPDVQRAAEKTMENNGALFGKIEQGANGSTDGHLRGEDIDRARTEGRLGAATSAKLPSADVAAKRINDLLDKCDAYEHFSLADIQKIGRGESLKGTFGAKVHITREMQEAAQKLLENDNQWFTELDKGQNDKADGLIGTKDYEEAARNGRFTK